MVLLQMNKFSVNAFTLKQFKFRGPPKQASALMRAHFQCCLACLNGSVTSSERMALVIIIPSPPRWLDPVKLQKSQDIATKTGHMLYLYYPPSLHTICLKLLQISMEKYLSNETIYVATKW